MVRAHEMRLHFRPMPIMSVCALLALGLLIWLGAWQWRRFEEKMAARSAHSDIVELAVMPDLNRAVFVFAVRDGQQGWRVFAPVTLPGQDMAFVDIAFWPGLEPPRNAFCFLRDSVRGVWRASKPSGGFRAPDAPAQRRFYSIQLDDMAKSVGLDRVSKRYFAADYGPEPNPFVHGADPLPPQRHLGYALTWWGLGAGLIGIYCAFHVSRGRLRMSLREERQGHGPN